MLTTLSTIKSRLAILDTDTTYDTLLTNALNAFSTRFDHETNRILARTADLTHEFDPADRNPPPATPSSPSPNSQSKKEILKSKIPSAPCAAPCTCLDSSDT
jgi:hypothetical protein